MNIDEKYYPHFLTFSCYHKMSLFKDSCLYQLFIDALDNARNKLGFELFAFVVMPDHVHMVVYPGSDSRISEILYAIKRPFSFRASKHLCEHHRSLWDSIQVKHAGKIVSRFWQRGGGFDKLIFKSETLFNVIEYIHSNPVRKGLVKSSFDWKWSSIHCWERGVNVPIRLDKPRI